MPKVELRPAYAWDCDQCGRENFVNGIVITQTCLDQGSCEDAGVDEDESGDWMLMPDRVMCSECRAEFETQHFHEADQ